MTNSVEKKLYDQMNGTAGYWFNKSSDLNRSALVLWQQVESGNSIGLYDVYKMLMGMSFEAMAKAFSVALGNDPKKTHQLTFLFSDTGFKFTKTENKTLRCLTNYIEWAGKYPTPKSKNGSGPNLLKQHWDDMSDIGDEVFNYSNLQKLWLRMSERFMADHNV